MGLDLQGLGKRMMRLGFTLADQIVVAMTYTQTTAANYVPAQGDVTPTLSNTNVTVILLEFKASEINNETVRVGDQKALVKAEDLAGVVPGLDDYFTGPGNVRFNVVKIDRDAATSRYIFQVRRYVT